MLLPALYNRIAKDPEYHICKIFLQFQKYGVVIEYDAYILEDQGLIRRKEYKFPEAAEPKKLYRLTDFGKRKRRRIQDRWSNHFVQKYALKSDDVPDFYLAVGPDYCWAFSKERLEQERKAGRFAEAISRSI